MKGKIFTGILLKLFLASMLTLAFNIQPCVAEPSVISIDGNMSDWNHIRPVATDPVGDTFQWSKNATICGVGATAEKPGMVTGNVTKNDMCRDLKAIYFVPTEDYIYMRVDVAGLYPGWNATSAHGPAPLNYANVSMWMVNFDFASGGYINALGILEELNYSAGTRPDFYLEWDGNVGMILGDAQRDSNNWDIIVDNAGTGGLEVATNITEGAFEFSFSRTALETFFGLPIGETYVWAMAYKPGEPTGGLMPANFRRLFDPQAPGTPGECQKEWGGLPWWPGDGSEYTWTDPWGVGHNLTTSPAVKGMDGINSVTGQPITLTYSIPIDFADIFSQTGNNLDTFTWAPSSWRDLYAQLNEAARFEVDLTPWATIGPKADFAYKPPTPFVNQTVTLNASNSLPGWNGTHEPPIISYEWNFGDGTNGTGIIINHTYTEARTFRVTLNVTDTQGRWDTTSKFIMVLPLYGPTADFYVDDDNTGFEEGSQAYPFNTIQEGINAASSGHTIYVYDGTYYEHVVVNKSVSLIGENKYNTIIDGNFTGTVVKTMANNINITCFTIQKSGSNPEDSGIYLDHSSGNNLSYNIVINNANGISLSYSSNNVITGNNASSNMFGGIWLVDSSNNILSGNFISKIGGTYVGIGIYLANSGDCTIYNNTITAKDRGIHLVYSSGSVITNNTITKSGMGISCQSSSGCISDNTITFCSGWYGIELLGSLCTISGNTLTKNYGGIFLHSSGGCILRDNDASGNLYNFAVWGAGLSPFIQDIDPSNTADGKPVYYWVNQHNKTIPEDAGWVAIVNSTNITVKGLNFTRNFQGVLFAYTTSSTISDNNITENNDGIFAYCCSDCTIANNVIISNDLYGLCLEFSSGFTISGNTVTKNAWGIDIFGSSNCIIDDNTVTDNTVYGVSLWDHSGGSTINGNTATNNEYGIYLRLSGGCIISNNTVSDNNEGIYLESSDCYIYHNNFINNARQVHSISSKSSWDDGYPSGGNYWSDYTGTDVKRGPNQDQLGSDGIGDTPYIIDVNNQDNYPLMNPFGIMPSIAPKANFTYSPEHPLVDKTVTFNASNSILGWNGIHEVSIANYAWDFGDGNTTTVATPLITHAYTAAGTYNITLTVTDDDGLTDNITKSITIQKLSSTITIMVSPSTITFGDGTTINGTLSPKRTGVNVTIRYRLTGETEWQTLKVTTTDTEGKYSYIWVPSEVATYELKAGWQGDENTHPAESSTVTLTVNKAPSTIIINVDPTTVTVGNNVTINGTITPTRANVNVTIQYRQTGESWTTLATVETDSNGHYTYTWTTTATGTYEVKARWIGDANTLPAESETKTVTVEAQPIDFIIYPIVIIAIVILAATLIYFIKTRKH